VFVLAKASFFVFLVYVLFCFFVFGCQCNQLPAKTHLLKAIMCQVECKILQTQLNLHYILIVLYYILIVLYLSGRYLCFSNTVSVSIFTEGYLMK